MHEEDEDDEPFDGLAEAEVEVPITDVLDLHTFKPREVASVVREYLDAACERGFSFLRIVHGRGVGVQRQTVRTILARDPRVRAFGDAPPEAGGWGATWVEIGGATAGAAGADGAEGPGKR